MAAIAKMPYGVSCATSRLAFAIAWFATASTSSSTCFRSTPISATPMRMAKSTTAGTTLLASEWNGLEGMNSETKSKGGRFSTSVVLKNDAVSIGGNARGNTKAKASATSHKPTSTAPARAPSVLACS